MLKKVLLSVLCCALSVAAILGGVSALAKTDVPVPGVEAAETAAWAQNTAQSPKYVFLFIGDGMSYPQFQTAADYLGALEQEGDILTGSKSLSFMQFPVAGSANTFDSTSFCPDSASTATSIATGYKTHSGVINMDETRTISYETIAEKLKAQREFKIGIISSVNLNHAIPAAFYAHQASRNSYYEIGLELIGSGFDYFAGGGLKQVTGAQGNQESLYDLAEKAGYQVVTTQKEAAALAKDSGKAIVIGETLADSDSLSYDNDREEGEWALKDYVAQAIDLLDNENGFFLMVEGGKIDWACHANDAGSTIADTIALDEAVREALGFYAAHPDETLILVTGDHETGGLTIGYAGTDYDTYLANLKNQKISYARFDSDYVAGYKANKTPLNEVLRDVKECFGLIAPNDPDAANAENANLVLTSYEYSRLVSAYNKTMSGEAVTSEEEYLLYGSYEPLTVTITHILNNKSGINFASYAHTGLPVAVFAQGAGQELFEGYYDNTDIYKAMASLLSVR